MFISAYNHLLEPQNGVTATSETDNRISANIGAFQIQNLLVMENLIENHPKVLKEKSEK